MPRNCGRKAKSQEDTIKDGLSFDQLMQWSADHNARNPAAVAPKDSQEAAAAAAAATASSSSRAYTGSTAMTVSEGFSNIDATMRAMNFCVLCKNFVEPSQIVVACAPPEGQRMMSDHLVPPCMVCNKCAREDKHRSNKSDTAGNKFCKACPATQFFHITMYESLGKEVPRHLAMRKNVANHRCPPCANSTHLNMLNAQFRDLRQTVDADMAQHDRTQRILAAKLEFAQKEAEKNASGLPASSHGEREKRRQQIREQASGIDSTSAVPTVVEAGASPGGAADPIDSDSLIGDADIFGDEAASFIDYNAAAGEEAGEEVDEAAGEEAAAAAGEEAGEEVDEAAGEEAAAAAGEEADEAAGEEAEVMDVAEDAEDADRNSEIGSEASRLTRAAHALCGGANDSDSEDEQLLVKRPRVGGSTAVRSAKGKKSKRAVAVDSSDEEPERGGAQPGAVADEAERQAVNYKCPKRLQKEYSQFLIQPGKTTADWIAHLEVVKRKAAEDKKLHTEKAAKYDSLLKERDQLRERVQREANSKTKAVRDARQQGADRILPYSNALQQVMHFLIHLGIEKEDVQGLVNNHVMAAALFDKYPVTDTVSEVDASGGSSADASVPGAGGA